MLLPIRTFSYATCRKLLLKKLLTSSIVTRTIILKERPSGREPQQSSRGELSRWNAYILSDPRNEALSNMSSASILAPSLLAEKMNARLYFTVRMVVTKLWDAWRVKRRMTQISTVSWAASERLIMVHFFLLLPGNQNDGEPKGRL